MIKLLFGLSLLWVTAFSAVAHEGEDHGAVQAHRPTRIVADMNTQEVSSSQFELVVKYKPLLTNQMNQLMLYLSDYATNAPIPEAQLEVELADNHKFKAKPKTVGVYEVDFQLPFGSYSPIISISTTQHSDLMTLDALKFQATPALSPQPRYYTGIGLALGFPVLLILLLVWKYRRRRTLQNEVFS